MGKALLFINGKPPKAWPKLGDYDVVACTDGALIYLEHMGFPLEKLDFVSGDFDSITKKSYAFAAVEFIETPDQNKTDFHKALDILTHRNITEVDVYGGSGGEQDHYLGNLSVAYRFREVFELKFYDEYSTYFFIPNVYEVTHVKGRMISLVPFPYAEKVQTTGLNWPLHKEDLDITTKIGTRNFALEDRVTCRYTRGALLLFIGHKAYKKG